jgi:tRNA (cytosine34-C5)-methyltransferase
VKKNGQFYTKFEKEKGLMETMFPPDDIESFGLENCLRIYPHFQNCGGFFVAVLEKVSNYGAIDNGKEPKVKKRYFLNRYNSRDANGEEKAIEVKTNQSGWSGKVELPFLFLSENNAIVDKIFAEYSILDAFPRNLFVVRSEEESAEYRHIYMVSEKAKTVLTAKNAEKLKLVNTGVKLFTRGGGGLRDSVKLPFRISNEGIQTITPYLSQAKQISVSFDDLSVFIKREYPKFQEFSQEGEKLLKSLEFGNYLLRFDPKDYPNYKGSITNTVIVPILRANVSTSLLLDKAERKSLLSRLTGEDFEGYTGLDEKGTV